MRPKRDRGLKAGSATALREVALAAGRLGDQADLYQVVVDRAREGVGGDAAVLRWHDPASGSFRLLASTGTANDPIREVASSVPTAIGEAFSTLQPVIVSDYGASSQTTSWGLNHRIAAQIAVPLLVEGRPVGTLAVLSFQRHRYTEEDETFLAVLAAVVAPALEAARLSKEVRATEELFSRAFAASGVGMALTDLDGLVVRANPSLCSMLGLSESELASMSARSLLVPEDLEAAYETLAGLYANSGPEVVTRHVRVLRPDGHVLWTRVTASMVQVDGEPRQVLVQVVDVTEERRAQAILESEHERLEVIIEAQREIANTEVDLDRLLKVLSERMVALTGFGAAAVMLPAGDQLVVRASAGEPLIPVGFALPVDQSLAGLAFRTGEVQRSTDARGDDRVHQPTARTAMLGAMVSAPLVTDDAVIGVLQLISNPPSALDETDERTLQMVAGFAAAAFQRATIAGKLREREHRLRAVLDSAPDPIVLCDPDGQIVDFNPAAEAAFLLSREEAVGKTAMVLLSPKHVDGFVRWNTARKEANSAEYAGRVFEATGRRSDGTEFPMEIVITELAGQARLTAAFLRDLTMRDKLKESRERLASVVASAPLVFIACDKDGVISLAEGSGLSAFERAPGDAVGRNIGQLANWTAEASALIGRVLHGERLTGRLQATDPDVVFGIAASPMLTAEGVVTAISVVLSDVTARVRAEEAQRESEAKSRLMAMMNHEVRTPLSSILGFAHLLKDLQAGQLNEKQQRYVANIETSGNHLLALVNDSLELAKLEIGQVQIEMQDLPVVQVMEQAADQVQPLATAKGLSLLVIPPENVAVRADRRQLVQVLLNLLSNAIRHTRAGGTVSMSAHRDGERVLLSVADTGDGIPQADQARIFEEFFKAGNHAPGGIGLGLAICRRLVRQIGGTITVESELGAGSVFTVSLQSSGTSS